MEQRYVKITMTKLIAIVILACLATGALVAAFAVGLTDQSKFLRAWFAMGAAIVGLWFVCRTIPPREELPAIELIPPDEIDLRDPPRVSAPSPLNRPLEIAFEEVSGQHRSR